MIVLEPVCGICNRLRAIESAIALSEAYNEKLCVVWRCTPDLNCRFDNLFEQPDLFELINIESDEEYAKLEIIEECKYRIGPDPLRLYENRDAGMDAYIRNNNVFDNGNSLYISTGDPFYPVKNSYSWLAPAPDVRKKMDEILKKFEGKEKIGLHIRRTDQERAITYSPTSLFIEALRREKRENRNSMFFLATDDLKEKKKLLLHFPNRLITQRCVLNRDSSEGIEAGAVDLFCLAGMDKIYGSFSSSFTIEAAKIGHIPLQIIKKKDKQRCTEQYIKKLKKIMRRIKAKMISFLK